MQILQARFLQEQLVPLLYYTNQFNKVSILIYIFKIKGNISIQKSLCYLDDILISLYTNYFRSSNCLILWERYSC